MSDTVTDRGSTRRSAEAKTVSVLVVSHVGSVWGAQRRLLELVAPLLDEGVRLSLASPLGELSEMWQAAGGEHQELTLPPHRGIRRPGSRQRPGPIATAGELSAVARSAAMIARRARGYDLIQSHSLWAHLETALAGHIVRRPVILDLHDIVDEGAGRRVLGVAVRLATVTLANSAATARTVPGSAAKIQVVHPGIDVGRFHPGAADPRIRAELTADPSATLVAIIGRIDPNKGVDVLVEAISRLSPRAGKPHLVVIGKEHVGAPEYGPALRKHAADLLGDRVRFLAPRDDIPEVLRAVDVLVNASRHEPFGRTILEAQACGVPVVGTNAGGAPELIHDGETGILVPPFDVAALEHALTRLLSDATLQRRLSSLAADQARTQFSLQSQARAAASVYRSAVRRG